MQRGPLVIAHRGASGYAPENSLAAIRLAGELGADGIELDLQTTSDGAFLLRHDPLLPDGRWIRQVPLAEAMADFLPEAEPATLAEGLAAAGGLDVWLEVKHLDPRYDNDLLEAIDAGPEPGRVAVHSFDHRVIARLGEIRPSLPRGILFSARPTSSLTSLLPEGAKTLWQEWTLVDEGLVHQAHAAGVRVIAWTVNNAKVAGRLAAMGVDGLCGDYPDRLRVT